MGRPGGGEPEPAPSDWRPQKLAATIRRQRLHTVVHHGDPMLCDVPTPVGAVETAP
ncbi:MAG: hypothetical protein QOI36_1564 [Pseudonocardiales bacterium]|jgi:hypothetical protein|nr:hypothetical protein [Pseudonocardiales bacterium]